MIAISSHRPHSRSAEFARNQAMAKRTWEPVFQTIVYAGAEEPELDSEKTEFYPTEDFPTIQTLAKIAASQRGISAILNADILINNRIRNVEQKMWVNSIMCGSSRRYHFDPHAPNFDMANLDDADRGRDIFVARQHVWQRVADQVPPHLRIGHQQWDAWMTDFFRDNYNRKFIDFTNLRCVFHPRHGDRQMPYASEIVEGQLV
jgi:hypothetical protein